MPTGRISKSINFPAKKQGGLSLRNSGVGEGLKKKQTFKRSRGGSKNVELSNQLLKLRKNSLNVADLFDKDKR